MACRTALFIWLALLYSHQIMVIFATIQSFQSFQHRQSLEFRRYRSRGDVLDLRSVTTTGDADTNVELSELVKANDKQWLVDLYCGDRQHVCPALNSSTSRPTDCPPLVRLRRPTLWPVIQSIHHRGLPGGAFEVSSRAENRTLVRRMAGSTSWRGRPLTLIRPLPVLH